MLNGSDYIPKLPKESYNKLMWSVSANTTKEEIQDLEDIFGNANRVYFANTFGCKANYYCGASQEDADYGCLNKLKDQCPFGSGSCPETDQCYETTTCRTTKTTDYCGLVSNTVSEKMPTMGYRGSCCAHGGPIFGCFAFGS